ncbi:MAG: hypothetical protein C5S48_02780 [Candidatus Methanogaster sp.]|nr:MAG: hypothetical protein C5S48_02780 [ANME-2 cluster archaeon]
MNDLSDTPTTMETIESEQEPHKKVKFVFKKSEEYQIHYVNGAFGGITPRGDVLYHLFFEYRDLPGEEELALEEGKLKPQEKDLPDLEIIRDLKVGIIMTPEQAENLANWLLIRVGEINRDLESREGWDV